MLKGFICLDGARIELDKCLTKCRMKERCLTKPTLRLIARQREWKGLPSTTQLLNGTMLEFLKLTRDFYVYPETRAFAVLGTLSHSQLESEASADELSEMRFYDSINSGQSDYIDPEDKSLTDYKTWGAYHVAKFLGMTYELIDDPSGALYQRKTQSGGQVFQKGHPKQIKLWLPNPLFARTRDVELQLNDYRIKAEKTLKLKIKKLKVQVTVRDGDTATARNYGVDWRMRLLPVSLLPDGEVIEYFADKAHDLIRALDYGEWDTPCSQDECWERRRCSHKYCEVWDQCPQGLEVAAERSEDE